MARSAPLHNVSHPQRSSLELHDNDTCTNPSTMYEIILENTLMPSFLDVCLKH
ncbi:hypothetical protein K503DRAFT_773095 [Rhizopogon vinicolor AM-OR11-026]|uniref:Uncharacterized protein n=1 Tax=Rhizopogon vinicolor AM-OR11-026 TaxID=1314800 RepID=A0A1B7MTA9_9AGAM|nr:hypothetical protein K503DRAFT_773095 [Rhizopogon vinicolor AM-OR11-026]